MLALAAGTLTKKGKGGQLKGIYLWLRHSPKDTGLDYWVHAKYQHLQSLPELATGTKVKVGQVIARSGKTGTAYGHFGIEGYPHLHLTTRKSTNGKIKESLLFDPLAIYHDAANPGKKVDLLRKKKVVIPYVAADGRILPPGTRVVWPVASRVQ